MIERRFGVTLLAAAVFTLAACGGGGGGDAAATVESPTTTPTGSTGSTGNTNSTSGTVELRAGADRYALGWNAAAALAVMDNDASVNTTPTLSIRTPPTHGTAVVDGTAVRYTPAAGYFGPDAFTYTLAGGGQSADAAVDLTVSAQMRLTGSVADGGLAGGTVNLLSAGSATPLASVQADAQGAYALTLTTADPSTFVSLQATGAGARSKIVLSAMLGDAATLAKGLPSGSTTLAAVHLPALQLSYASTALAALVPAANGGSAPTSSASLTQAEQKVDPGDLAAYTAAIQLVGGSGVALPSDVPNTQELLARPSAVTPFLAEQMRTQNARYTALLAGPITAGTPLSAPAAGEADVVHTLVSGSGVMGSGFRLLLRADGSAQVAAPQVRSARWNATATTLVLTYDSPVVVESVSDDVDPVTNAQNWVRLETLAIQFSSISLDRVQVRTVIRTTYLDGSRKDQSKTSLEIALPTWLRVRASQSFSASDFAAGIAWAGVLQGNWVPGDDSFNGSFPQDTLRIDSATAGRLDHTGASVTWQVSAGQLRVTQGGQTVRYTRLFTGAWGEERWLAEGLSTDGALAWIEDVPVVKAQTAARVTMAGLVGTWSPLTFSETWGINTQWVIGSDGGVSYKSTNVDTSDSSLNAPYLWGYAAVSGDGQEFSFQRWAPASTWYDPSTSCRTLAPPCLYIRGRFVRVVAASSKWLYGMEFLDYQPASTSAPTAVAARPGYRLNVYRREP